MYFRSIFFSILILISGVTAFAQDHQHTDHLTTLLEHYMDAKEALAEDNFDDARSALTEFRKEVVENDEMNDHQEHSQKHTKHHGSMVEAVEKAVGTDNPEDLRRTFKDISDNLIMAVENQEYDEQTLHLQYCPMAVSDEGAQWISDQEEIVNPYMGQKMPNCGEVEDSIN